MGASPQRFEPSSTALIHNRSVLRKSRRRIQFRQYPERSVCRPGCVFCIVRRKSVPASRTGRQKMTAQARQSSDAIAPDTGPELLPRRSVAAGPVADLSARTICAPHRAASRPARRARGRRARHARGWPTGTRRCCTSATGSAATSSGSNTTPRIASSSASPTASSASTRCRTARASSAGRTLSRRCKARVHLLFNEAEFGLGCPINVTDGAPCCCRASATTALKARYLDGLTQTDMAQLSQGAQFMTEKEGGSDVGRLTTVGDARGRPLAHPRRKVVLLERRCRRRHAAGAARGRAGGTRGLGLFLMPRRLDDGSPNRYRIVRLKDKLGTRSMASGEIKFDGAIAYAVGSLEPASCRWRR